MDFEQSRTRGGYSDELDFSYMYDDIERMREREEEEEKEQNEKLGAAGMMAMVAGVAILAMGFFGNFLDGELASFLFGALHFIGFGALGYGFLKTMRLAFRTKELNFPALNVYRKQRPQHPPLRNENKGGQSASTEEKEAQSGSRQARTQQTDPRETYRQRMRAQRRQRYRRRPEAYRSRSTGKSKTLSRSRTNRVFAGVAGGIAEYFGISSALVRFAFIAAMMLSFGMPIFIYLLLSIILPANYDSYENPAESGNS